MSNPNRAVFKAVQSMLERHRDCDYFFYGDEERHTECKPIKQFPGITTLVELFSVLEHCWDDNTANPIYIYYDDLPDFILSFGQCDVTAILVYDMFGGSIHKIKIPNSYVHYFNKLNGNYVDLTREQFDVCGIPIEYEPNHKVSKEYCLRKEETVKRYKQLQKNIINYLLNYKYDFYD